MRRPALTVGRRFDLDPLPARDLPACPARSLPEQHSRVITDPIFYSLALPAVVILGLSKGGFAGVGIHVHIMQGTGILMMMLFLHLFFAPWRRFRTAVDSSDFALAAKQLGQIRMIVGINLVVDILYAFIDPRIRLA